LGNNIHDTGQSCPSNGNTCKLYHAVYFGVANHQDFGWNLVDPDPNHTGIAGCRAVQFHTTDNSGLDDSDLHVHDNIIRNAICDGLNLVTVNPDQGPVEVYNNLVYHVGTGPDPSGVQSDYACLYLNASATPTTPAEVFNNTFYDCGSRGTSSGGFNLEIKAHLQNNIVRSLSNSEPYFVSGSLGCSVATGSNNLFYGAGTPSCANLSGTLSQDPAFVNPSGFDFHLQSGSPAHTAGVVTSALFDLDGNVRPSSGPFDIGAYQTP
jgi:hypothetical protein